MKQRPDTFYLIDSFGSLNILFAFFKLSIFGFLLVSTSNLNAQITSACGIYTGTGATKTFTNLGFDPDVVIIKAADARYAFMKTTDMGTDKSVSMNGAGTTYTDAITALGTNGFTLSTNTNVNNSGTVYNFYAFKETADLVVATYTGDAAASRTISTSFKVIWAVTAAGTTGTDVGVGQYMSASSTNYSTGESNASSTLNTYCSGCSAPATGFLVADGNSPVRQNISGVTYYYFAMKAVAGSSESGVYVGTSATKTVTTGFTPTFITIAGRGKFTMRSSVSPTVDATQYLFKSTANTTNRIQSLGSSKFVVGTNADVNDGSFGGWDYQYVGIGNSTILPVELTEFSGTCSSNGVQLNWTTATELNNDYFLIEKSSDGYNWTTIDKVKGSAYSITKTKYTSNDDNPTDGLVYYRLSQVDIGGKVTVFKAIDVNCNMGENNINQLILFPNPTTTQLNAQINASKSSTNNTISLVNKLGQVVFEKKIPIAKGVNVFYFPIEVASGSYTVLFSSDKTVIPSQKLMIVNP